MGKAFYSAGAATEKKSISKKMPASSHKVLIHLRMAANRQIAS